MFPTFPIIDIDITDFFELAVRYGKRKTMIDPIFEAALDHGADLYVETLQKNMHRDKGEMADSTKKERAGPLYYRIVTGKEYWKYENARKGTKKKGNPPLGTSHEFQNRTKRELKGQTAKILKIEILNGFKKTRQSRF